MIVRVTIETPDAVSVSFEYPVELEGDISVAVQQALEEWRKNNPGRLLLSERPKILIENV
jgi:hypothetical protein